MRGEVIFGEHEKAGERAETFGRRGGTVRRPRHNELDVFPDPHDPDVQTWICPVSNERLIVRVDRA